MVLKAVAYALNFLNAWFALLKQSESPFNFYSLSDKYFARRREEVSVFLRKTETLNRFILAFQTKVWTPIF
jgi:hypothetical protein